MNFTFLLIHLFCAIVVVGYMFFDAIIYPFAKKSVDEETLTRVKKAYTKGSAIVFGIAFLLLLLSGAHLAFSNYIGGDKGFLGSSLQILLMLKIGFVFLLILVTFISVFFVRFLKKPNPFGKYSHLLGLIICLIIVFLAKAMIYL
ncbi:MAG: trehalose-6-phosphate synthase [Campylobacter sp.]|nr:trehalose-6-phosphate synthase [Campylobacter sp.]